MREWWGKKSSNDGLHLFYSEPGAALSIRIPTREEAGPEPHLRMAFIKASSPHLRPPGCRMERFEGWDSSAQLQH